MKPAVVGLVMLVVAGCLGHGGGRVGPTSPPPAAPSYQISCPHQVGWHDPCTYRASHSEGSKQEMWTAVNPTDPGNVIIGSKDLRAESSRSCVWNGLAVTDDGGVTWTDVVIGGTYASRAPASPFYGYACNTDPEIVFGPDGKVYALVEMYNLEGQGAAGATGENRFQLGWKFVLARSDDGGMTWPIVTTLDASPGVVAVLDYSRMAVVPSTGTVVAAWSTFNDLAGYQGAPPYSGVTVVAVRNNGLEADAPQVLFPQGAQVPNVGIGDVVAAPDGTLTLLFDVLAYDSPGDTYVTISRDDGKTWSKPDKAFHVERTMARYLNQTRFRVGTHFELASDAKGRLFVAYAANDTGDADVLTRWSPDHGVTWSTPVTVGADAHRHAQWHPNLAVTSDGWIHLVFFDRAYDVGDRLVDVSYAYSEDGGSTWRTHRVTNASFDGDLGRHQMGFPFIGDYLGIDAVGHDVWLGFPDTSPGLGVIAAAHVARV